MTRDAERERSISLNEGRVTEIDGRKVAFIAIRSVTEAATPQCCIVRLVRQTIRTKLGKRIALRVRPFEIVDAETYVSYGLLFPSFRIELKCKGRSIVVVAGEIAIRIFQKNRS